MSGSAKLITGLVIGAAVGAAITAFIMSDKKEEILQNINDAAKNARQKIGDALNKGMEELDVTTDRISSIASSVIERNKADIE